MPAIMKHCGCSSMDVGMTRDNLALASIAIVLQVTYQPLLPFPEHGCRRRSYAWHYIFR